MMIRSEKIITIKEVIGFEVIDIMESKDTLFLVNDNKMIKISIKNNNDIVITLIKWEENYEYMDAVDKLEYVSCR